MKTEQKQLLGFLGRLAILGGFCAFYAAGGSQDFWGGQLWIRRWLATFLLCVWGAIVTRGDWRSWAFFPAIAGALTLPYGADALWIKILLRGSCGLAAGVSFNFYNFFNKRLSLAIFGIILSIVGSIFFGAFNPWSNAIIEQGLIALCYALPYVFSVQKTQTVS